MSGEIGTDATRSGLTDVAEGSSVVDLSSQSHTFWVARVKKEGGDFELLVRGVVQDGVERR